MKSRLPVFAISACLVLFVMPAGGVILFRTGDPSANTTAPTGDLANSGWQYQGTFGGFLGTPISPNHFVTAKHVSGGGSAPFVYAGVTYTSIEPRHDPYSDLTIWRVAETLPSFAPLYTSSDEVGRRLAVFGRGTQRGGEVVHNGTPRGWFWGPGDGVQRWGENIVTDIIGGGPANEYVYATLDAGGLPNEAHLSTGDSGGAVFIQDGALWKLAGISYAVDGPFYPGPSSSGEFFAALYDARDFYYEDPSAPSGFTLIAGPQPVATGFYATRISSKLAWIYSVIDPGGDANANGVSNLVEHARGLNAPPPAGIGAPQAGREPGFVSITYRKLAIANPPLYVIEQSNDLKTWNAVAAEEVVVALEGEVHVVKARVPYVAGGVFLRVKILPPA